MSKYIMTVQSNPVAGREDEYNDWYDKHHVREIIQTPTFVAGQRYKMAPLKIPDRAGYQKPRHAYMVVYEFETDDLEKTKSALWSPENVARIKQSTSFDSSDVNCHIWMPIGPRHEK